MKSLLLIVSIMTATLIANAAQIEVYQFDVIRSGGGSVNINLNNNGEGQVSLYINGCIGKSSDQSGKSVMLMLSEKSAKVNSEALAILNNQAILAEDQSVSLPGLLTGTWQLLKVYYRITDSAQLFEQKTKVIREPVVIINGKLSSVLTDIESIARKALEEANEASCMPIGGGATIGNSP